MPGDQTIRSAVTTDPQAIEFSLYAFLKLYVYGSAGRPANAPPSDSSTRRSFSARRIHRLLTLAQRGGRQFTDFYDISSYFVRTRLENLNHGTALIQTGRGLRRSITYQWNETIDPSTRRSYDGLRRLLGERVTLAYDVFRLVDAFGTNPFGRDQFLAVFRAQRDRFVERRWYKIATSVPSSSVQFTHFLLDRLGELVRAGLVEAAGPSLRLTRKGEEVHHWMELFLYSAQFVPRDPSQVSPSN
ncbi:MAG: hypothetical protein HYT80_08945 [Euryarchaeota archaeon]|nr:hypothetical protein [Euryarchaeota archaeon]